MKTQVKGKSTLQSMFADREQRIQKKWQEHQRKGQRETLKPSAETLDRIAERANRVAFNIDMITAQTWGMVKDWHEVFALGHKNCLYCTSARRSVFLGEPTDPDPSEEQVKEIAGKLETVLPGASREFEMELFFWDRCARIYAEEMKEAEKLAAEARERAAQRIESEFGKRDSGVADALRKNNPQEWAAGFDWN